MASKVAFQDRMVVRVKDEREAYGNCTDNHGRSIGESFESKYDSNDIREQVMRGEKTVQENREHFKKITGHPRISVKQERAEGFCYSSRYTDTPPSASGRNRIPSNEITPYESREETMPENVKEGQFTHSSRPESKSRSDSGTYPDSDTASRPTSRVRESLFSPWQPRERMENRGFVAAKSSRSPHTSFLCFPAKRVFSHFQTTSPFTENFSERRRHFSAEMKEEAARREQEQTVQHKANRRLSSVYRNGNVSNDGAIEEELRPRPRQHSLLPPDRTKNSCPLKQNGSTQRTEKSANSGHLNTKEEEPVWKKYQWYRDRKRPYSQQTKRQKTEKPIFMQYNEIRDKRSKEGRVVSDKRIISEPWRPPLGNKSDLSSSSSRNTATGFQSSKLVTPQNGASESSSSPTKRRKISNDSALSEEGSQLQDDFDVDQDFLRDKDTNLHYNNSRGGLYLGFADQNGNFEKHNRTENTMSSHEVKSRNDFERAVNNYVVSSPRHDEEITGSALYEERVNVSPGALRRYPQDVAKILRLNRIVKAVKNNRMGQQATEKMKRSEGDSREIETYERKGDETRPAQRPAQRPVQRQETNQDRDDRPHEQQTTENENEELDLNDRPIRYFFPQDQQQILNGMKIGFEEHPDFSSVTHSSSDQESFLDEHMNAVDDNDPVCQVNGLLSLPGLKETKFNITLGELKRRMNPPETLTRVEMISYVRQAKSSGRVLLDKNNIVTANRSHPTILSRVCENEAQVLADGILKMNREYLPMDLLARKTVNAYKDDGCRIENCEDCRLKLRRRIVDVEITRNSLKELQKAIEETKKEHGFQTFELASHTFGVTSILNHLTLLDDYFRVLLLTLQDE